MSDPKYAYPYPAQGSTDRDLDFKDEKEELLLICFWLCRLLPGRAVPGWPVPGASGDGAAAVCPAAAQGAAQLPRRMVCAYG
jgi:hypothetical protein